MSKLLRLLLVGVWAVGCWLAGSQGAAQALPVPSGSWQAPLLAADLRNPADDMLNTEFGKKIDLNNTNVRAFRRLRGFYPTLARKIVANAPYQKVEDVLTIPGLSEGQKSRLQANLDKFTVLESTEVFTEGGDRFNNGYY